MTCPTALDIAMSLATVRLTLVMVAYGVAAALIEVAIRHLRRRRRSGGRHDADIRRLADRDSGRGRR